MQKTIALAAVALVALVAAPAAQADNPQITVPLENVENIADAATGFVEDVGDAVEAFQTSAGENVTAAQGELTGGSVPATEAGNILTAAGDAAGAVPDAASVAAGIAAANANGAATDKIGEAGAVANAAVGVGNSGIRAASTVANAALVAACQQPLPMPPGSPVPCSTGSIQAAVAGAAQDIADAALNLTVDTDPTEDAARDLLNGLVVGLGDTVLGP